MTTFVAIAAIYGAVLSSLVAFWNWRRGRRDKGIVKISARMATKTLILRTANTGRRPITLGPWRYLKKKGTPREVTIGSGKSITLNESEEYTEYTTRLDLLNDNLAALYVVDTAGKKWKINKKILRRLIEDAKAKASPL